MNKWVKIGMFALGAALAGTLAGGLTASAQVLEAGRGPGNGGRGGGSDASLTAAAAQTLGMTRVWNRRPKRNTAKTIAERGKGSGKFYRQKSWRLTSRRASQSCRRTWPPAG